MDVREQVGTAASKASDTGSIKDSASDAGSTATDYTSMSQGTLVSGASTAFYPPQVHFFSLDDFAGHEIGAILEDGEAPEPLQEAPAEEDRQSVRPGSIVSNIEHRLDELEGAFQGDAEAEPPEEPAPPPPSSGGAGSSSQHLAESLATELHQLQQQQQHGGGGGGGGGAHPQHQQTVESLLAAMQYRDLTPADLALLRRLQDEAAVLQGRAARRARSP